MSSEQEQPKEGDETSKSVSRRDFLKTLGRAGVGVGLASVGLTALVHGRKEREVWQIDPNRCVMCGKCATECVLPVSAARCVHNFEMCGYCDLCFGYLLPNHTARDEAAENQVCPLGAINRKRIEGDYYEYSIKREQCNGCAKCVKLCTHSGNGSLFLQIQQDFCAQCNACAIARACPSGAIRRVAAPQGYLLKEQHSEGTTT